MCVLVGIDVRDGDARRLNLANLRGCLKFDLFRIQAADECAGSEGFKPVAEASAARICLRNGGELLSIENGLAVDQNNMTAYAETRNCRCPTNRIVEGACVRHQRRGAYNSASMSFDDGAIDAVGEAKIIGVDDQAAHRVSLAGRRVISGTEAGM